MTEVLNASISISSSLLLKYNEFILEAQQSHSNAIEEIALQMNVDFINFNEFSDVYEIRSDLYGDNVRNAFWKKKSRPVVLKHVPGYSIEEHHRKLVEEVKFLFLIRFPLIPHDLFSQKKNPVRGAALPSYNIHTLA